MEFSSSYYHSIYHWFMNSINDFKKQQILLNKYFRFFLYIDIHIILTYEIFYKNIYTSIKIQCNNYSIFFLYYNDSSILWVKKNNYHDYEIFYLAVKIHVISFRSYFLSREKHYIICKHISLYSTFCYINDSVIHF